MSGGWVIPESFWEASEYHGHGDMMVDDHIFHLAVFYDGECEFFLCGCE